MKNSAIIFSILIMLFISNSCGKEEIISEQQDLANLIDLSGDWLGAGYECPFVMPSIFVEKIRINHNLKTKSIFAYKITGDPCVPAGDITFTGEYDGKATSFLVSYVSGSPTNPSSGKDDDVIISVINRESLVGGINKNINYSKLK